MKAHHFGVLMTLLVVNSGQAALVVYTDQSSFLASVGSTTVYDFESVPAGDIKAASYSGDPTAIQDFGEFTIDATHVNIYHAEIREEGGNSDVYMDTSSNTVSLNVIFDMDITAFGFSWTSLGTQSYDQSKFSLLGNSWILGGMGDSGFFGVVQTEGVIDAGVDFSFGQNSSNWVSMSFDNLTYSVPEPSAMLLFGAGLAGFVGMRRRRGITL